MNCASYFAVVLELQLTEEEEKEVIYHATISETPVSRFIAEM